MDFKTGKAIYDISIHVLRMENDATKWESANIAHIFQSTFSAWRTTIASVILIKLTTISIHVLRMENDGYPLTGPYIRTISIHVLRMENDGQQSVDDLGVMISIHVLRMENDSKASQNTVYCILLYCTLCPKAIFFYQYYSDLST